MATNNVYGVSNLSNMTTESSRVPKQEMGQDEFLQILAAQLANQDPLEPMKDTDFIAQMAQFSALEQMSALNQSFSATHAYTMIGKDVLAQVSNGAGGVSQVFGRVAGVSQYGGEYYLSVGEYYVPVSAVLDVYDSTVSQDAMISQAANLIGKTIDAQVPLEEDEIVEGQPTTKTVSGEVEYVVVKGGSLFAKLKDNDTEVAVSWITKIY
ncbi:MAG: flagellar hook capping FlgD N-terminal domain-containing protein [Christensenellaceae bacterium]|jgi:hypothetical protein